MKLLILLLSFSISSFAAAVTLRTPAQIPVREFKVEPLRYQILLNPEFRYERESSQQMVFRQPLNIGIGLRKEKMSYIFEFSRFTEKTGNTTLSVERAHQEYVGWLNYSVTQFGVWNLFAGLGAGIYQETVKTSLNSSSATDAGEMQGLGGASFGVKALFIKHLIVGTEARLLAGQNFDPNPQLSLVFRIGAEF
jgi:hypothetical protein